MAPKKAPAPAYEMRETRVGPIAFCLTCDYNSSNEEYAAAHVETHKQPPPAAIAPVAAEPAPAAPGSSEPSTQEGSVANGA